MAPSMRDRAATEERQGRAATEEERRFAEELGFYWEDAGGTRMAGRVLGALLLADPPDMSSASLAEFLGISAGSVSTATRELIRPGLARRVRVPGDRQDYFRATMTGTALTQILRTRIEMLQRWQALMQRGQELMEDKDPDVGRRLQEIEEFWRFLEIESRSLLDRWARRPGSARPPG